MAVYKFRGLLLSNNIRLVQSTVEKCGFVACGLHSHYTTFSANSMCSTQTSRLKQISVPTAQGSITMDWSNKRCFSRLCNSTSRPGYDRFIHLPNTVILLSSQSKRINVQPVRWVGDGERKVKKPQFVIPDDAEFEDTEKNERDNLVMKLAAIVIFFLGASFASVPLYRVFCQKTGRGGKAIQGQTEKVEKMKPGETELTILFNADVDSTMRWNFKPQQSQVKVRPGETALAFYTATNPCDKPIIGISTYTVAPWEAGLYFNKIQCFCFEEQRLDPGEQVDMPVFFYIDPEFEEDPALERCKTITLSYTFFESKDQLNLPYPGYSQNAASIQQTNTT